MAKQTEMSASRKALLRCSLEAIRAWIASDIASTPAKRTEALRRARLLTGRCFNHGMAEAEKELAQEDRP